MEHAKHIVRVLLLLVLVVVVLVCVRHFLIPKTFGEYGHYRFASLAEHAAREPRHGGPGACAECHEEEAESIAAGKHNTVPCEVCHAPLSTHVKDGARIEAMAMQRSARRCAQCHQRMDARPSTFPQVDLVAHVTELGETMSDQVCWECHENAHNPTGE